MTFRAIQFALLAPAVLAAGCSEPRTGCWGVSPTGVTWRALMPEHSGTGTLADFFHDQLRVDTCGAAKNKHAPRVHEPAVAGGCDDDVHFVLAANPFRRVISAAAMRQKITGGRRLRLAKSKKFDRDTDIRAFRAWVRTLREPPVRLAADLVQSVKNLTYVVKTNQLQEDTLLLLDALGYPRQNFTRAHCVSSCATRVMRYHLKEQYTFQREVDPRDFYDKPTAARVRRLFAADFSMFAFSTEPERMLE